MHMFNEMKKYEQCDFKSIRILYSYIIYMYIMYYLFSGLSSVHWTVHLLLLNWYDIPFFLFKYIYRPVNLKLKF